MSLRQETITIDANDVERLAGFWSELLGWPVTVDADGDVYLEPPPGQAGVTLLFEPVPEAKSTKNRLHLDLRPDDQAAEVARAEALGARRVSIGQGPDVSWVVLADPEGNEFCILRSAAASPTG